MLLNNEVKYFFLTLFFVLGMFAVSFMTGDSDYYYFSLALSSLLPVLGVLVIRGNTDVFSPLYLVLYMLVFSVVLKTLYLVMFDSIYAKFVSLDGRELEILEKGLFTIIAGMFSLCAGYLLFGKNKIEKVMSINIRQELKIVEWPKIKVLLFFTILISFAFNAFFIYEMNIIGDILQGRISVKRVHEGTIGESSRGSALTYIRWGAQTLPQVVLLCCVFAYKISRKKIEPPVFISFVILFFLSALIPIITSARLELAYAVVLIMMILHYGSKMIKLKSVIILGVFVLVAVAALGLVRYSQTSGKSIDFGLEAGLDRTLGSAYLLDVAKTSVVVDSIPSKVDYLKGKSFGLILFAPIPRSIWPEKPVVRISRFVGDELYNRADSSGVPPGFIAEAYMNFGFLGMVVLLFGLGAALAVIYERLVLNTKSVFARTWYAVAAMLLTFTLLSGDFTILVSQAVRYGLIIFIVQKIVVSKYSKS